MLPFIKALLFLPLSLFAMHMGSPNEPEIIEGGLFLCDSNWWALKAGIREEWVEERRMEAYHHFSGHTEHFSSQTSQLVAILNLLDRVELYASMGAAKLHFTQKGFLAGELKVRSGHDFTWGIGGKSILMDFCGFTIGIDGKYQVAKPDIQRASLNAAPVSAEGHMDVEAWQVSGAASYSFFWVTPYAGLTYSFEQVKSENFPLGKFAFRPQERIGGALGCTFSTGCYVDLTLEAHVWDQRELSLSASLRF